MGVIMHKRESYPKNGGGASEMSDIFNAVYPVGSIYMSVNNVNPGLLFGGTWEAWGSGRVPVGVDANDTDFDTVEETGGEKTHALTVSEMPTHNHGFTGTASKTGTRSINHRHAGTTDGISAWHYHFGTSGGMSANASHHHDIRLEYGAQGQASFNPGNTYCQLAGDNAGSKVWWGSMIKDTNLAHTHSIGTGIPRNSANNANQNHTHTFTSAYQDVVHDHDFTPAGTVGNNGSGTAHNVMNPYITCYMWKRTA